LGLLGWGATLTDGEKYSPEERERLSDAAHDWEMSFAEYPDLLGVYRAALGKCYFLGGNYLSAAGSLTGCWLAATDSRARWRSAFAPISI
jgi:hypothetical protein